MPRRDQEILLAAAKATTVRETFEHAGVADRRVIYKTHLKSERRPRTEVVLVEDPGTGETIDLTLREDEAFWSSSNEKSFPRIGQLVLSDLHARFPPPQLS
ncbi:MULTISPECIES: hypothetical protein [unclassified Streptomyces]|uniref:hypothetical protein n=1 Tax=unclassified Streptomyces TaxID=2593676 RepID=UPI002E15142B|nr:hypothetical protein OG457_44975 [Streptomyces sp. NBC_01207]